MLRYDQIEKLEIIHKWLEEITESEEFAELDIYPDATLEDSLEGVKEVLTNHYPCGYEPPKPVMHIRRVRPWHEKLRDHIFVGLGEVAVTSLLVAAVSGCLSLTLWGASEIKAGMGYKKSAPDFAAQSQMYRGMALASLGLSLGASVGCSVIARAGEMKDV